MATLKSLSCLFKSNIFLLMLALVVTCATAARILDEDAAPVDAPLDPSTVTSGTASSIAGGVRAGPAGGTGAVSGVTTGPATGSAAGAAGPIAGGAAAGSVSGGAAGPLAGAAGGAAAAAGGAIGADADAAYGKPVLSFFMHDILGGSNPSAKAVTGIVANPAVSGQVPFAKPNGAVLPQNNGAQNNGINNNNIPFLSGLSGFNPSVFQNNNNNGNNLFGGSGFPVVNGGQLPQGTTVQKLMFGTLTVMDDELTEGHELGSGLVGKAEGFYIASSEDGTSQTMAFTALFQEGGYVDSICFFGVHRTAVSQSVLAIMGGTGKYVNAKGVAIVKTFPATIGQETDGVETLLELSVYLTTD